MQGDELKALRMQAGLTQARTAEALGVSANFYAMMERGERPIEPRTALAVNQLLRARIDIMHSDHVDRWIVSLSRPGKEPVHREHHIIGAKATLEEAQTRAEEVAAEHPGAKITTHPRRT